MFQEEVRPMNDRCRLRLDVEVLANADDGVDGVERDLLDRILSGGRPGVYKVLTAEVVRARADEDTTPLLELWVKGLPHRTLGILEREGIQTVEEARATLEPAGDGRPVCRGFRGFGAKAEDDLRAALLAYDWDVPRAGPGECTGFPSGVPLQ